jgi:acyl-CoA thioesterase
MKTIEEVREFFKADRYAHDCGVWIAHIDDGYAKCTLTIEERHQNAAGTVMGGVLFTMADFTCAVAANWNRGITVTIDGQINYLGVAKGGVLTAEARRRKDGRTLGNYEVVITDADNTVIATAVFNVFQKL